MFRRRAEEKKDDKAIKFIKEYEKSNEELIKDPVVKGIIGHEGERNIVMHRSPSRIISVQRTRLSRDERYELDGEPKSHFIARDGKGKGVLPSVLDVTETLTYCLAKLSDFRGHLAFGIDYR